MFEEIVKGVTVRQGAGAIEQVELRNLRMDLLASWDGTEVIRSAFSQGKRFGLTPQAGWNALEYYYILEGTAVWESGERSIFLGPGDSVTGSPVQETCMLRAVTDVVALYVSSRPSFHVVSQLVTHLQEMTLAVEAKDGYTSNHCGRIQDLAVQVGKRLKLDPERQFTLFHGAYLHDLGKVGIPDEILLKPGKLTNSEWQIMRQHPTIGGRMLANTAVSAAARVLEQHHERIDGSGYPLGLKGDEICVEAKIVAVVDSYDAMTTDRVYRAAMPKETALKEITELAGVLYDPYVVDSFLDVIECR